MSEVTIHAGDNRESLRRLIDQGVRVHSVVTDPPYGLVSIQKRFGKEGAKPARTEKNDGSFARLSGGFMGQAWDATGIERDPEFWKLIYDILLPGGYVFAFSGSRTGHWQACAMEMAGFVMHPMHGWTFGSGFPKAHNAAKAIEAKLLTGGAGPKNMRMLDMGDDYRPHELAGTPDYGKGRMSRGADTDRDYKNGAELTTEEARQWEGWAYGTQTQKPALEPIYLGQKPFSEKTGAANLLKHGVGAVNIDGCRVVTAENLNGGAYAKNPTPRDQLWGGEAGNGYRRGGAGDFVQPKGRHPSNLILDGSPEVVAMFPAKAGAAAPVKGTEKPHTGDENTNCYGEYGRVPSAFHGDSGSAARFFHQFPRYACETCLDEGWVVVNQSYGNPYGEQETCPDCDGQSGPPADADPLFYHPKAGKGDRAGSRHPTVKPIALMQYLIRHITPPGGIVLDPFAGSGTTAEAAKREGFDCILMEAEEGYLDFLYDRFDIINHETDECHSNEEGTISEAAYMYISALGFPPRHGE